MKFKRAEDYDRAREIVKFAAQAYLRESGWTYAYMPGSYIAYTKEIEGRKIVADLGLAMSVQGNIEADRMRNELGDEVGE